MFLGERSMGLSVNVRTVVDGAKSSCDEIGDD
jgi:hypothetical protein